MSILNIRTIATSFLFTTIIVAECITAECPYNFDIAENTIETEACYGELKYACVTFRHGDRNPYMLYPTDPWVNYSWPNGGLGHLTDRGKQKEFELGKYCGKRYGKLTGPTYSPQNFMINSSDVNRTIESGMYFADGFFSSKNKCDWNDGGITQDIPIYVIPECLDNVFLMNETCPLYYKLSARYYKTDPFIDSLCDRFSDVISYCQKYSGLNLTPCRSNTTFFALQLLYDTLFVESSQFNLTLPSWTEKVFPYDLSFLFNVTFNCDVNKMEIRRLKAGPLLGHFKKSIEAVIESLEKNTTSPILFNAYSAHDSTIATIMISLGVWDYLAVPYGASFSVELRFHKGEYCVTLFYQNSTNHAPYFLELPLCPHPCSFKKFAKLIKPLIPRDWESECHYDIREIDKQPEPTDWKPTWSYWLDPKSWFDKTRDWRSVVRKYWPAFFQHRASKYNFLKF